MLRQSASFLQFIWDFRYYRRNGYNFKSAWLFATLTIP